MHASKTSEAKIIVRIYIRSQWWLCRRRSSSLSLSLSILETNKKENQDSRAYICIYIHLRPFLPLLEQRKKEKKIFFFFLKKKKRKWNKGRKKAKKQLPPYSVYSVCSISDLANSRVKAVFIQVDSLAIAIIAEFTIPPVSHCIFTLPAIGPHQPSSYYTTYMYTRFRLFSYFFFNLKISF